MRKLVYALSLVLIFTIPWEGATRFGLGTVATLMGIVVSAFWIALILFTGEVRRPNTYLAVGAVFVFWVALSPLWSADPRNSMGAVLRWTETLILAYILWDLYRTRPQVLQGLQAFLIGTYAAIAGASANFFGSHAYYTNYQRYSPGSTNPDGYGFTVALGVPVACYLAASPDLSRRARLIALAYLPVGFVGLALSGTRTASVAAAIGLLFGLALLTRLRLAARIAVVCVVAVAMFFVLPIVAPLKSFERFATTGTEVTQGDLNGRTKQWEQGFQSFEQHPFTGVGADQYRTINTLDKVAHNSYVSVLVELGLIGFVLFATILWIVFTHALILPKWDKWFWITELFVWAIGASTLTYEHRKTTWFFLTMCVSAGAAYAESRSVPQERLDEPSLVAAEPGGGG
jgi:O-antigen ligase